MHDVIYNLNLVVSSVLVTITIIFSMLFYTEWRKQKRTENEQYIPLALTVFYILLSVGFIMMTNSNYFIEESLLQLYIQRGFYYYLIMSACIMLIGIFVYIAERIIPRNTHHLFLIYYGFLAASFYIFKAIGLPFIGIYLILLIPIVILMGLFAYHLIWKASGQIRQKMLVVTVGYVTSIIAIVMLIRFLMISEYVEPFIAANYNIPLEIKTLLVFALALVGWGFYTIPSFTEFDWKDKIQSLYLLNQSGICLYNHDFQPARSISDEVLFGGGLMAMQSLIQELIQSEKGLNVIDHQEVKIIFLQSANAIAVLISEEDLYIGRQKIQQFLKEFELLYGEIIKDWAGDLNIFKPLTPIVNRIFEVN